MVKPSASTSPHTAQRVTYGDVLKLAWPASIAASVTPLLGAIDVWALAHSPHPLDVAAVGLGSIIFSLAYWSFGFIRMSVAGLTAQASGAEDQREERAALARGIAIGAIIGVILVCLQRPVQEIAFPLLALDSEASTQTLNTALDYYGIRIWGAPFAIATYALFGWLTAKGRTDFLMIASITIAALNAALDYWFVAKFGWGAGGVAAGTLIAEIFGFVIAAAFVASILAKESGLFAHWKEIDYFSINAFRRTLSVNRDIFLRTLLLSFSFAWFTQRSGAFGDVTLAANQVLLQLFLFTGLALDGTAIAAETLIGRAIGDRDRLRGQIKLKSAMKATFIPAIIIALCFTAFYLIAGNWIISVLTQPGEIRATSNAYLVWIIISPLVVVTSFQLDGVFIGATKAKEMRNGMIISVAIYILASIYLAKTYSNHGLWAAFSLFFIARAVTLGWYFIRQKMWTLEK